MKPTSLSERELNNHGTTEMIILHSALRFTTFLIKVSLAECISIVILDALLIREFQAGSRGAIEYFAFYSSLRVRNGKGGVRSYQ